MDRKNGWFSSALLAAATAAPAQFYVVDASNGPGTDFTSIVAALAATSDGAVLLVRPGLYSAFVVDDKDVTVICSPSVAITPLSMQVRNLSAGKQVTLHGMTVVSGLGTQELRCTNNAGTVVLDRVFADILPGGEGTRLVVTDCADVRVRGSRFESITGTPLSCVRSQLRLVQTVLLSLEAQPGCHIEDSFVEAVDVNVRGSGGTPEQAPFHLVNSTLRLLGSSYLRSTWPGSTVVGPAINGTGSLRIDPDTTLVCGTSAPIGAGVATAWRGMPAVTVDVPYPFGVVAAVMTGPTNGIGALWLGLMGPPVFVAPYEDAILIQPGSEFALAMGPLVAPIASGYVVPPHPLLLGVRITWQGASIDPTFGVQIGNAVTYVHG